MKPQSSVPIPAVLATALLMLAGCAASPSIDSARDMIREAIDAGDLMSAAFSVSRHGEVVWEEAYGLADAESNVVATPDTPYSLASISKPVTTTALMILVERGLIDLDRPVDDYLGETKLQGRAGDPREATVRLVAAHYAGLPVHSQFFLAGEDFPRPAMDETIRRYGVLMMPPGRHYQYSNLGYGILEYIIERVSGKTYDEFLREEIFGPLGMTHSSAPVDRAPEGAAVRYWDKDTPFPFYDFDHRGASAVYTSARDLTRFGVFHLGLAAPGVGDVLSDSAIKLMQKPIAPRGETQSYGIGWVIDSDRFGYRTVSHTGGMGGVTTTLILVPDEQITVAVLLNSSSPLYSRVADELLAALLPRFAAGLKAERAKQTTDKPKPSQDLGRLPPGVRERLRGKWRGEVHTWAGQRTLHLWLAPGDVSRARLEDQPVCRIEALDFDEGFLRGTFDADIGAPDASRREHRLRLKLALQGDRLRGAVTATGKPSPKPPNGLSYWADLERVKEDPGPSGQAAQPVRAPPHNRLTSQEQAAGWELLFDGETTGGWSGAYGTPFPSDAWLVDQGSLRTVPAFVAPDIATTRSFEDFELQLEWRIAPGGNSGVLYKLAPESRWLRLFYRGVIVGGTAIMALSLLLVWLAFRRRRWLGLAAVATVCVALAGLCLELAKYPEILRAKAAGLEMQVLDDERHPNGKVPSTSAGALYGLIPPEGKRLRPVGEFNQARIVVNGNRVEHWLNGARILHYEPDSEELKARITWRRSTPIALQHHGSEVRFRNIKVRPL